MEELIKQLNEKFPGMHCVIVFHKNAEGKPVLSPLVRCTSVAELTAEMINARDGIQHFLNDLVSKTKPMS